MKLLILVIVLSSVLVVISAIHLLRKGQVGLSPKGSVEHQREVAKHKPARVPDRIR